MPLAAAPFVIGATYRVRHDFIALRDTFRSGEVRVYERDAYSRYDGMKGCFFSQPQGISDLSTKAYTLRA